MVRCIECGGPTVEVDVTDMSGAVLGQDYVCLTRAESEGYFGDDPALVGPGMGESGFWARAHDEVGTPVPPPVAEVPPTVDGYRRAGWLGRRVWNLW